MQIGRLLSLKYHVIRETRWIAIFNFPSCTEVSAASDKTVISYSGGSGLIFCHEARYTEVFRLSILSQRKYYDNSSNSPRAISSNSFTISYHTNIQRYMAHHIDMTCWRLSSRYSSTTNTKTPVWQPFRLRRARERKGDVFFLYKCISLSLSIWFSSVNVFPKYLNIFTFTKHSQAVFFL